MGSMGCGQGVEKHTLVFMATGLFSSWQQPLGFFVAKTVTPAEKLKTLLLECLTHLQDSGLDVHSVIFDQGTNN